MPHTLQTLQEELAVTRKKLQGYADTIVSLHGELRTLRDAICKSCKQKFRGPSTVDSSSLVAIKSSQSPAKCSKFSRHPLLKARPSDHIPSSSGPPNSTLPYIPSPPPVLTTTHGDETPAPTSNPVTTPQIVPRWSAQRDATANVILNVTFIREFVHKGEVRSVRFSADGKYLAAALTEGDKNGVIFIYNVETGDKYCELAEYASRYSSKERPGINCVCFSPNGRYLVVGDVTGRVTVWDIPNKRICNIFRGHKFSVESVDLSPNGRLVMSASWDVPVCIWNMRDSSAKVFADSAYVFCSVKFSPDGQFVAAGSANKILAVWDVRTGQLVRRWTGHQDTIRSVAFTPDGMGLVSGGFDGFVKCWDVSSLAIAQSSGEPVATPILEYEVHTNNVYAVSVSPDAQWIASGLSNGRTVIWDDHTTMPQCTLIGHKDEVSSVDFSTVGSYLALSSYDRHVTLWRYTELDSGV